jgi:hypothetical protein
MDLFNQTLDQYAIMVLGSLAAWLTQDTRAAWRRWACIFGLLSQPFWFYACWRSGQAGLLLMAVIYTAIWARGLINHWLPRSGQAGGNVLLNPNGKRPLTELH